MPLNPLVSVIIPAYNADRYIRATLDSVLAQTYPNIEIVVADDGSTDRTRDCVAEYGDRITYVYGSNSGGAARPRNAALALAKGEFVVPLDADDILLPDRIAREVEFLLANPSVALAFSDYHEIGNPDLADTHFQRSIQVRRRLRRLPPDSEALMLQPDVATEILLTQNFGHSSPMVRRSAALAVGGWDESTIWSEDFWFGFSVASKFPIALLVRVGWHKRNHPLNLSANTPLVLKRKIKLRQRILDSETTSRRRRKVRRMIGIYHFDLAYYYTGRDNREAWRHAMASLKVRPHKSPRLLLRLVADVMGRDTNGAEGRVS